MVLPQPGVAEEESLTARRRAVAESSSIGGAFMARTAVINVPHHLRREMQRLDVPEDTVNEARHELLERGLATWHYSNDRKWTAHLTPLGEKVARSIGMYAR